MNKGMTQEEKREQVIIGIADLLRKIPFEVTFKVKKKPNGIKVIYEVTQEEMDSLAATMQERWTGI